MAVCRSVKMAVNQFTSFYLKRINYQKQKKGGGGFPMWGKKSAFVVCERVMCTKAMTDFGIERHSLTSQALTCEWSNAMCLLCMTFCGSGFSVLSLLFSSLTIYFISPTCVKSFWPLIENLQVNPFLFTYKRIYFVIMTCSLYVRSCLFGVLRDRVLKVVRLRPVTFIVFLEWYTS